MEKQPYPTPPPRNSNADQQARYLAELLQAALRVGVSPDTVRGLRGYISRVGSENYDDLVASIFLECWKEHKAGAGPTERGILLAADRVRQRLIRQLRREVPAPSPELSAADDLPPDEEVNLVVQEFHRFLAQRPGQDAVLFHRYYIDGERVSAKLAEELGMSPATVYRRLKSIRDDFASLRNSHERPTASD